MNAMATGQIRPDFSKANYFRRNEENEHSQSSLMTILTLRLKFVR